MSDLVLQIKDLSFAYEEGNYVLEHVSADIYKSEKIAVLGANGAGKSTFFLNLNGVREPESGEILLHGDRIGKKNRNLLRKSVGIVFQDADSQIIASTVKAEVAFGPLNLKLAREEVENRTLRSVKKLNLQKYLERPPHYLSGGEKKRVSIADILAMEPEIIIFDEPMASLDPVHANMLEAVLDELGQEGKTVLLSTHNVDFAYRFSERVLLFHEGKLIADGDTYEIFRNKKLLEEASLKKPLLMQVTDMLRRNGLINNEVAYPKTLMELEKLL